MQVYFVVGKTVVPFFSQLIVEGTVRDARKDGGDDAIQPLALKYLSGWGVHRSDTPK